MFVVHYLAMGILFPAAAQAAASAPAVELGAVTASAGSTLLMPLTYQAATGEGATVLVIRLSIPAVQIEVLDVIPDDTLVQSGKNFDFEKTENQVSICIFGGNNDIPVGGLSLLYLRLRPDPSPPETAVLMDAGTHGADKNANLVPILVQGGTIRIAPDAHSHTADRNGDWCISLQELLRMIQFYNVGAHHCESAYEDGFAPGAGDTNCALHDADYNPPDWKISFVELLRIIQLYNGPYGVYHALADSEDGFSPGPFGITYDKRFPGLR